MSERSSRVADGFVRSFRDIVDRVDPQDLVLELVQRRILPPSYLERQPGERRREVMMKLLGRVYRQSLVDNSTYADFVSALDGVNTRDPGHRYEDIIQELGHANSEIEPLDEVCPCHHLPFSEVERRVFDCTRRVAERCLEPDSVLPDLVSAGTISFEACMEVAEREDRLERVHHLMETILSGGSQALGAFVRTLLDSDDRSASGVGHVMHECLEAHRESPYTLPEWLGKSFDLNKYTETHPALYRFLLMLKKYCIFTSRTRLRSKGAVCRERGVPACLRRYFQPCFRV